MQSSKKFVKAATVCRAGSRFPVPRSRARCDVRIQARQGSSPRNGKQPNGAFLLFTEKLDVCSCQEH